LDPGYTDAARRRAERVTTGAPASRWRHGARAGFLLAMVLVGLLLAVAYRHVLANEPTRSQVRANLEQQIHERSDLTDDLQLRADQLRDEVARLRDEELADPQARLLRQQEASTGLMRVTGDGAVVRVDDGPPTVDPATGNEMTDPEARILDVDLQRITNGLWAAGAEAIAINDRRLTAISTIRSASGAILVDRVPVVGPYQVTAIGPDNLADRFADSAAGFQMQQLVSDYGISYEVRSEDDLTLPAAAAPELHHAAPADGDS
jgi:uncharacterized protein YlxW (UPF0749 family)